MAKTEDGYPEPLTSQTLIEELRGVMDDTITHFEQQTGKTYKKTRDAIHHVCNLAQASDKVLKDMKELQNQLQEQNDYFEKLKAMIDAQKDVIKNLETEVAEQPPAVHAGSVLLPTEPTEDILWRMSGRPNGPSFPEMEHIYKKVIKAVLEE